MKYTKKLNELSIIELEKESINQSKLFKFYAMLCVLVWMVLVYQIIILKSFSVFDSTLMILTFFILILQVNSIQVLKNELRFRNIEGVIQDV